jgi:hypothetical protein
MGAHGRAADPPTYAVLHEQQTRRCTQYCTGSKPVDVRSTAWSGAMGGDAPGAVGAPLGLFKRCWRSVGQAVLAPCPPCRG